MCKKTCQNFFSVADVLCCTTSDVDGMAMWKPSRPRAPTTVASARAGPRRLSSPGGRCSGNRASDAPSWRQRPLWRQPLCQTSQNFSRWKLISLRDTKITTLAPFKASGKPLKSDKAMVNIFLESFGILSSRPLLRLTGCFIQLEVMKVATPHFQLQFRFVECNGISGGCTEHWFSWWWKKMLIFLPSSCIFHLPSKLGHKKRCPKVSQHLGTKGRSTGGCSSAGRFTTSVCFRWCMSAAAAACNTPFATWQKLFKCSSEILDPQTPSFQAAKICQQLSPMQQLLLVLGAHDIHDHHSKR